MVMQLEGRVGDRDVWGSERCSATQAMQLLGSPTALLFVREAFYGTTKFSDFVQRVGVTDTAASNRLKKLVEAGVFQKRSYRVPGARTRDEYLLTPMGEALLPVLLAVMSWGDEHLQSDGGPVRIVSTETGRTVRAVIRDEDDRAVDTDKLKVVAASG